MTDLSIKPVTPPVVLTGLSSLAPAQARPPASPPASPGDQVEAPKQDVKQEDRASLLEKAAANIEKYIPHSPPGTQLRIEKDKGSNLFVYQSVNPKSGEVVSQYPTEQILQFISYYREKEGLAVDQSA